MSIAIDPTNHELRQGLQEALRIILAEKTVSALREDHARSCDKQVGWSMECSCGFAERVERLRQLANGITVHMPPELVPGYCEPGDLLPEKPPRLGHRKPRTIPWYRRAFGVICGR